MSTFFYPNAGFAQSIEMETDGTNIYIPSWKDVNLFMFSNSSLNLSSVTLPSGTAFGASCGTIDSNNNLWIGMYDSYIAEYATPSLNLLSTVSLPSGTFYIGMADNSGYIYSLNSAGNINTIQNGNLVATNVSLTQGLGYTGFVSENSNLYTVLGTSTGASLCITTMTSQLSGTTTYVSTPYFSNTAITVASGNVCIGGYNTLSVSYPIGGMAYLLNSTGGLTNIVLSDTAANTINTYQYNGKVLSFASQASGNSDPTFLSFDQTGTQLFACNPSSNNLQIFTYSNETLSISQTLSITNPTSVSFLPNNTYAFVTQGSSNEITVLINSSGSWSIVSPVLSNTGATSLTVISNSEFMATTTNAINIFEFVNNAWSLSSSISLSYTPTELLFDGNSTVYAIGVSGTTESYLTSIVNNTVQDQISWTGTAQSFYWYNGVLSVFDSYNNNVQNYITVDSTLQYETVSSLPLYNPVITGSSAQYVQNIIIISSSTDSYFYENNWAHSNFITPVKYTGYSVYNGTSWTSNYNLSSYGWVTSITSDTSGNFWLATSDNYIIEVSNTGTFTSASSISPVSSGLFPPLGISKMLWLSGHLYGISSIGAGLIQIM